MGVTLLLADDSITIQKVVGIIFATGDYQLTTVNNGDEALEKVRQFTPDIALIDTSMPGKNGYEVCQAMRQDPRLKQVPILLMTGAFEPFDEEKARQCGADDFITKPFESQQLISKVTDLLASPRIESSAAESLPTVQEAAADDWTTALPAAEPAFFESAFTPPDSDTPSPLDIFAAAEPSPFSEPEPETPPVSQPAPETAPPPADDIWGAFELETTPSFGADHEPVESEELDTVVTGDLLSQAFAPQSAEVDAFPSDWGTVPVDEPPLLDEAADLSIEPPDTFSFDQPETLDEESFEPVAEPTFESVVEPAAEPVAAFIPPALELPEPLTAQELPAVAAIPEAGTSFTLSEAQLEQLVSRISRDVIERIAWEVVPDLAEIIIQEEIRKIKEG